MASTEAPVLVTGPGYYELEEERYHADPAPKPSLSSSLVTELVVNTAAEAKQRHPRLTPPEPDEEEEDDKKFDMGNVAHKLLLGRGREIAVIESDSYRTKAAKEARDEAKAAGQQPCLVKVYEKGLKMAAAANLQLAADPENFDAFLPDAGRSEVAVFWQEPVFRERPQPAKMWMRALCDRLMNGHRRIYDYKTFAPGADPDRFVEYLVRQGRDIQDPFYSRGVASIEGCEWDEVVFRYIVQHPEPPFLLSVVELMHDPEMENSPRRWSYDRTQWAIDKWARCAAKSAFPGYVARTHHVAVPAWAQTRWALRREADEAAERLMEEAARRG